MDTDDYLDLFNDLEDLEQTETFLNPGKRRERYAARHPKKLDHASRDFVASQDDSAHNFKFTYKAARFEEWWLLDSLGDFYEHGWISDVLTRIKGGKEASVYLCRSGAALDGRLVAAKVYRPRSLRNLKNDAQYRAGRMDLDQDGRVIFDDRSLHAIKKRTAFGEELRHQSWIAYEFQTLQNLQALGADVPMPYTMAENAILMGYVGDLQQPAPTLNTLSLDLDEAAVLFKRVLHNIDLMLTAERIHGDLSAYNILYWNGEIALIDFPQVVQPDSNPAAWSIFQRDVERVCRYFTDRGMDISAHRLATDLWTAHGRRIRAEIHPGQLDPDRTEDRKVWEARDK